MRGQVRVSWKVAETVPNYTQIGEEVKTRGVIDQQFSIYIAPSGNQFPGWCKSVLLSFEN